MNRTAVCGSALTLASIPNSNLAAALGSGGIVLDLGGLRLRVRSKIPEFAEILGRVYANFPFVTDAALTDAVIDLLPVTGPRRWVRRLAHIEIDGIDPFGPFPRAQSLPHFEWAVNWAFANIMNAHLLLHAGAVEVASKGVLLIARPGAGKSTLSAGLMGRGARLLSDEFGVVRTSDAMLLPMAKPIALKNRSIDVLRHWNPEVPIGPTYLKTRKGNLAHQAVSAVSAARVHETATPAVIIFPSFREGGERALTRVAPARSFMELAANSFNYELLGPTGFETVARLVGQCACYMFDYSNMEDAVETVLGLCKGPPSVSSRAPA